MNLKIHASSRVPLFCFGTVSNFHMEGNYSRRADSSVTQLCRLDLLDLILSVSATEPRSMEKYFSPALNRSSLRRGGGPSQRTWFYFFSEAWPGATWKSEPRTVHQNSMESVDDNQRSWRFNLGLSVFQQWLNVRNLNVFHDAYNKREYRSVSLIQNLEPGTYQS